MQAHGQEEMLTGHNQVGWSSNPGKCGCVVFHTIRYNSCLESIQLGT